MNRKHRIILLHNPIELNKAKKEKKKKKTNSNRERGKNTHIIIEFFSID